MFGIFASSVSGLTSLIVIATALVIPRIAVGATVRRTAIALMVVVFSALAVSRLLTDLVVLSSMGPSRWDSDIQAIAAAWLNGQPLYPQPSAGLFHGLLYGPLLFEILAAAAWCFGSGSTLVALPAVLAEVAAIALTWRACRQAGVSKASASLAAGVMLSILCVHYPYNATRADPFLLLLAALALLHLRDLERGSHIAAISLGLCCGVSAALKFTAAADASPALICVLLAGTTDRSGLIWRALLGGGIGLALPFLLPGAGFFDYWYFLNALPPPYFDWGALRDNLVLAAAWLLPLMAYRPGLPTARDVRLLAGVVIALVPTIFVAAISGAGPWHFLPFLPPLVLLAAIVVDRTPFRNHVQLAILGLTLAAAANGFNTQVVTIGNMLRSATELEATRAMVSEFVAANPGASVAIAPASGPDSASLQIQTAMLVGLGQPLVITRHGWQDMRSREHADFFIARQLDGCRYTFWLTARNPLTPSGLPVRLFNEYDETQQAFYSHYAPVGKTPAFDVWACKRAVPAAE
jgi:hypothetical protein